MKSQKKEDDGVTAANAVWSCWWRNDEPGILIWIIFLFSKYLLCLRLRSKSYST